MLSKPVFQTTKTVTSIQNLFYYTMYLWYWRCSACFHASTQCLVSMPHIVLGFHGVFPTQWLLVHDSTCLSMYFSCLACEVHVTFTGRKTSQTGNHSTLPRQYIAHNVENYRYYSFTFCETTLCLPSVCCHVCVVQFTCASHESTLTGKFTSLYIQLEC